MAKKKKKKNNIVAEVGLDGTITKLDGKSSKNNNLIGEVGLDGTISKYDIAPVKKATKKKEEEEKKNTWFSKGSYEDGFSLKNTFKSNIATTQDVTENITTGVLKVGEGIMDLGAYAVGGISKLFGADEFADKTKKFIATNHVEEYKLGKAIAPFLDPSHGMNTLLNYVVNKGQTDENSLLGEKSDSLVQSAGQLAATIGLQTVGVPWWLTTGTTSFGSGTEEAFKNNATYGEAGAYGLISAGAEVLTEKLSGGISFGGKTLDDTLLKPLTNKIANKTIQTLTKFGMDVVGEGTEEVITEVITNVGKKLTYEDEKTWSELLTSEEAMESYLDAFIGGSVMGGGFNAGRTYNSIRTGRDYDTGLSTNEQKVVDKEVENRIAEREKNGNKLTNKEKTKIQEQVKEDLQKGYIDIDTIESTLGGETYNQYKSITDKKKSLESKINKLESKKNADITVKEFERLQKLRKEYSELDTDTLKNKLSSEVDSLTKSDFLLRNSYNEKANKSVKFDADVSKYDVKQQKIVKKAIESGILNNTNKTHDFVDMIAKLSADKGVDFDFTNNEKLKNSGFVIEGKQVDGFVSKNGITLNIDSNNALNKVVGHEITHVLEGTELYTELQQAVKEYATTKGVYDTRLKELTELYKDVDDANIENELTSELVGEYLFTDADFVNNLSATKPNVFKKIYNEIKYLLKVATAGSKEARQLEKVKKTFEDAYKQNASNTNGNEVKYSLSEDANVEDKINSSMTMEEAKDMIQRIFVLNDIKNWYEDKYQNGDEWLVGEGIEEVEMYAENTELIQSKFLNKLNDKNNGFYDDYYLSDILEAYQNGKLTGEIKQDIGRVDTSKDTGYKDNKFYAPKEIAGGIEVYEIANQRVTNKNREQVYKARADFIINAHNKGYTDSLGLTTEEVNKKLKSWANYPKKAMELSQSLNENVAKQNQWTGLENSSIVNTISISDEDMAKMVKEIKGDSNGYQRHYITSTMLALDTHIDYSPLTFDFEQGAALRQNSAAGDYNSDTDVIRIGSGYQNTVAHEIGHYIDYSWGNELFGRKDTLSSLVKSYDKSKFTTEQIQFLEHFNEFQESIEKTGEQGDTLKYSSSRNGSYWQKPTEVFARFVGKFTEWTKNQATNNRYGYEEKFYKDRFTESQYREFVKILQEKSTLDTTTNKKYNTFNQELITVIDSITESQRQELYNVLNDENVDNIPSYQITEQIQAVIGKDAYYKIGRNNVENLVKNNFYENKDAKFSLSNQNEQTTRTSNNVYGSDIKLQVEEAIAPLQETITELTEQVETLKEELAPVRDDYAALTEADLPTMEQQYNEAPKDDVAPIRNNLTAEESQELDSLETLPFELDEAEQSRMAELQEKENPSSPVEEKVTETKDLFETRDYAEVGDRKVKAYQYDNPEVKPYFQDVAKDMLDDLGESIKGERFVVGDISQLGGGDYSFSGQSRFTTPDIAEMLDGMDGKYKLSYEQIRKGLENIIKDEGAENNAASKRIEFYLDKRLREGYTTMYGFKVDANQEYLKVVEDAERNNFYSNIPIDESLIPPEVETMKAPMVKASNTQLNDKIASVENEIEVPVQRQFDLENQIITDESVSELEKKQQRAYKKLGTKEDYVSNKASELYDEVKNLKKGVKASYELGRILDVGFANINELTKGMPETKAKELKNEIWRNITTSLLNVQAKPLNTVNKYSTLEAVIRQNLNREYDSKKNDIDNMKEEDLVTKTKKELRKALLGTEVQKEFITSALDNAKNRSMALMNNTDTIRNTELVFGRDAGKVINDVIFQKEIDNEADSIAWQNQERQSIKDLGIKARSKESAAVQKYGEKQYVETNGELVSYTDEDLAREFPNTETQEKIKNAAKVIRSKYDTYIDEANNILTKLGFDPIPKRKDYMRHFQELNDVFSRYGIPFNAQSMTEHVLPTDINGLTENWSPQKNYFANMQQRKGLKTTYDAITGIDGYIGGIANLIYHTEDIQRGRAFEELIRETYGEDKGFENLDNLPDDLKQARAEKIQDNHLSNYAAWVHEWTNNVAGKKSKIDRSVESMFGRKAFSFLDNVRKQVGSNMIGFNLSSSLTNLIAPVQAMAKTNKLAVVKGTADTIKNMFIKDSFMEKNKFLTSRMGTDMISKNAWQKIQDAGFIFMKGMDWFSSNQIVRSKYYELRAKGVSEAEAHAQAGQFAARILGDRTKGANAQLYNSKLIGLVTQFQLEVNNQLYSMFYDTYQESKENAKGNAVKTAAGMTFTLGQLFAFTHLFGKTFESIAGYNPTFDVIGILATALGWGEEEDEETTTSERLKKAADQLVDSLPYVNILTGGGRIPVASGIPNLVGVATGGKDQYGNELTLEGELKKLLYLIPPTGGNQVKKTLQGLGMFDEDLPVSGSYTDSGNLRYPVEDTPLNRIQAALFGQYANKNAGDYFDNERQPLKENQIKEYADLDMPISDYWKYRDGLKKAGKTTDAKGYAKYLDEEGNVYWYDKNKKTLYNSEYKKSNKPVVDLEKANKIEQIYDYITGLDVTDEQKGIMFNNVSKEASTDKYGYQKYTNNELNKNGEMVTKTYWYDEDKDVLYDSKYNVVDSSMVDYMQKVDGAKDLSNYNQYGGYDEFNFATKNEDKYNFLQNNNVSYEEYLKNKKGYDWAYENPEDYEVVKQIDTIENYMIYKDYIGKIKEQYSTNQNLTSKQKTALSKQRKAAVQQYIESLNLSIPQKVMLEKMAGGYSIKNYENYMFQYIESLPMSASEKQALHSQLFD